jgi:uncharacterized membrane protein YgaE (UPF0421/DUF939 family)
MKILKQHLFEALPEFPYEAIERSERAQLPPKPTAYATVVTARRFFWSRPKCYIRVTPLNWYQAEPLQECSYRVSEQLTEAHRQCALRDIKEKAEARQRRERAKADQARVRLLDEVLGMATKS